MQADVQFEGRRVAESLFANLALVRPLTGVSSHVNFQLGSLYRERYIFMYTLFMVECFIYLSKTVAARLATERLLVRMGSQVLQKMSFEGSLAYRTLEGFHST